MIDDNPNKGTLTQRATNWLFVVLYGAMIFFISSLSDPVPVSPPDIIFLDKIAHLFEYAIFGILIFRALYPYASLKKSFVTTIIIASLYGMTDEVHQYFVEMRDADVMDWFADTMGGLIGSYIGLTIFKGDAVE